VGYPKALVLEGNSGNTSRNDQKIHVKAVLFFPFDRGPGCARELYKQDRV